MSPLRKQGSTRHPLVHSVRYGIHELTSYYVYIMASGRDGTLYIGVTNDLIRRVQEHKNGQIEGFTKIYSVNRLVYFEETTNVNDALSREKQLKKRKRSWKIDLIQEVNPQWRDLYEDIIQA